MSLSNTFVVRIGFSIVFVWLLYPSLSVPKSYDRLILFKGEPIVRLLNPLRGEKNINLSQVQVIGHKKSISLKFDKKFTIRNKIPNTFNVYTNPSEKRTFRDPV